MSDLEANPWYAIGYIRSLLDEPTLSDAEKVERALDRLERLEAARSI